MTLETPKGHPRTEVPGARLTEARFPPTGTRTLDEVISGFKVLEPLTAPGLDP